MSRILLPAGFDAAIADAVRAFWEVQVEDGRLRLGSASGPENGHEFDGFLDLVDAIAIHCGLPLTSVHTRRRGNPTVSSFLRAAPSWDVVVFHEGRLLAAVNFGCQLESLDSAYDRCVERALANAADFAVANVGRVFDDGKRIVLPFLGWLVLLDDTVDSERLRGLAPTYSPIRAELADASFAERYRSLCENLVATRLYSYAGIGLTAQDSGRADGTWRGYRDLADLRGLFLNLSAQIMVNFG